MRESIHPTDRTQALQLTKFGDPDDSVSLVSRHTRQPVAGEVLIDLHGAPVHPSDIHLIRGFYGLRPELPMDLGADGAGTVVEAGSAAELHAARSFLAVEVPIELRRPDDLDLAAVVAVQLLRFPLHRPVPDREAIDAADREQLVREVVPAEIDRHRADAAAPRCPPRCRPGRE